MFCLQDLKRTIIDDGLSVLVNHIIIPHSGWNPKGEGTETCWSTVFRNTSGVLRLVVQYVILNFLLLFLIVVLV